MAISVISNNTQSINILRIQFYIIQRITNMQQPITLMQQPIPLIQINAQFQLQSHSLHQIRSITCPIIPICAIGSILIGKSSLLNQIIQSNVFQIGNSTIPKTKGIWAYPKYSKQPNTKVCYLFLDIQGFDRLDDNNDHDLLIMAVLLLLCKNIIYMNRGALESSVFCRVGEAIKLLPKTLANNPKLFLVQKDFSLKLLNIDGQSIEPEEYLELCLSNLKNKKLSKQIMDYFHINSIKESRLKSLLLPNQEENIRYRRSINLLTQLVTNQSQTMSIVDFILRLKTCVVLINGESGIGTEIYALKTIEETIKQDKQESLAVLKSEYRLKLEELTGEIVKDLPLPPQLISFRLKETQKTILDQQIGAFNSLLLGSNVQKITEKIEHKIRHQNNQAISKFIIQYVNKNLQSSIQTKEKLDSYLSETKQELMNSYSFLKDHSAQIETVLWKSISQMLLEKVQHKQQQITESMTEKGRVVRQKQQLTQKYEKMTKNLQDQINRLETDNKQHGQRISRLNQREQSVEQDRHLEFQQIHDSLQKYHQMIESNLNRETQMCTQLREIFMKNISCADDYHKLETKTNTSFINEWSSKLNKIERYLSNRQEIEKNSIQEQQQRINTLQKMNKMLRGKVYDIQSEETLKMIETKYQSLQKKYWEMEAFYLESIKNKQKSCDKLKKQIDSQKHNQERLEEQVKILQSCMRDKGKGTQFMQKLIEQKDTMLHSLRNQLLKNIEKSSKQMNELSREKNSEIKNLSLAVAEITLNFEKLSIEHKRVKQALNETEEKLNRKYKTIISQKQQDLQILNQELKSLQSSVSAATQAYQQVTFKLEDIIAKRENKISQITHELQSITFDRNKYKNLLEEATSKLEELKSKCYTMQLEKQKLENENKRDVILLENKCSYLNKTIEKQKIEIQQKQSTFDVMLKQLRGDNLIKLSMEEENGCKENLRKIEQKITKQLEHIDDENGKWSEKKLIHKSNHKKYRSDSRVRLPLSKKQENTKQEFRQQPLSPVKPQNLSSKFLNDTNKKSKFNESHCLQTSNYSQEQFKHSLINISRRQ